MNTAQQHGTKGAEVVCVIPARGGSKGLFRKNVRPLGGKPLIAWSTEVALRAPNISRVLVSTEDQEIAATAQEWGAEVPFLRPDNLAGDDVSLGKAVNHMLGRLQEEEGYLPWGCVVLLPTSPFRSASTVSFLVDKLLAGHRSVVTYAPMKTHEFSFISVEEGGRALRNPEQGMSAAERIYWYPTGYFAGNSTRALPDPKENYRHCIEDPVQNLDIDYMSDLLLAEEILRRGLFQEEA